MRVLVTIPHFFNPQGGGKYASLSNDPLPRISALSQCLQALHGTYSRSGLWYRYTDKLYTFPANEATSIDIDVIICTTKNFHLLDRLPVPREYYKHYPTHPHDPMFLGFECHALLRDCLGNYDYYCYLEDDLILDDPLFFTKLTWFNSHVGDQAVLQPNRYELVTKEKIKKVYIDLDLLLKTGRDRQFAHYQAENSTLTGMVMGQPILFKWAENPHSGCFFLNHRQMEYWAKQDYFLDRESRFFGPLESAASLGLMRTFRVYKPARQNASFLEIKHFGDAWSKKIYYSKFF